MSNREIIFKAISIETGEWVEGDLVRTQVIGQDGIFTWIKKMGNEKTFLETMIQVDPKTVCQFTGILDSEGVKEFEWDTAEDKNGEPCAVIFKNGEFILQHEDHTRRLFDMKDQIKITGNVFDPSEGDEE